MSDTTKSAELEAITDELRQLRQRVEARTPQTLLISPTWHLTRALRELEGIRNWAKNREARENQTSGDEHPVQQAPKSNAA